jgi:hypothetical protein
MVSRRDKNWEYRVLTEILQPPESSIDIDIISVAVEAMAEVLVDIVMLIVADGVGICMVISIFISRLPYEESRFSRTR